MLAQEAELIPVTALKVYLTVDDLEKAASTKPERITPFKNGPLAIREDIFDQTDHRGGGKLTPEHLANRLATDNGRERDLMIDGIFVVEGCQSLNISGIEGLDPVQKNIAR
jgi:hypothetical protein